MYSNTADWSSWRDGHKRRLTSSSERGEERFGDRVRHRLRLRLMASVGSELSV